MHAKLRVEARASRFFSRILGLQLRYKIALLLIGCSVLWFLGGLFWGRNTATHDVVFGDAYIGSLIDVREIFPENRKVIKLLPAEVHAYKFVAIVSEVAGKVEEVFLDGGSVVEKGQAILRVERRDKLEQLERAEKLLEQRKLEREASGSLSVAGYRAQVHDHATLVALKEAEINYSNALLDFENTTIRAPFSGVVDEIFPQVGSMIGVGQHITTVANFEKLKVVTYISEDDMPHIGLGSDVEVVLGNSDGLLRGSVSFMGRVLSPDTKSCRLEILVDNKSDIPVADGMSSKVRIAIRQVKAYRIPSSSISVDGSGNMGIKILDKGIVKFLEVKIVDDDSEGNVWVSGISGDKITLIVRGHEYVVNGVVVDQCNV